MHFVSLRMTEKELQLSNYACACVIPSVIEGSRTMLAYTTTKRLFCGDIFICKDNVLFCSINGVGDVSTTLNIILLYLYKLKKCRGKSEKRQKKFYLSVVS